MDYPPCGADEYSLRLNVMSLFEQTDRALTLSANQFAGPQPRPRRVCEPHPLFAPPKWWRVPGRLLVAVVRGRRNYCVCSAPPRCRCASGGPRHRRCVTPPENPFAIALSPAALPRSRHTTAVRCCPYSDQRRQLFPQYPCGFVLLPQCSVVDALPLAGRGGGRLDIVNDLLAPALSWMALGKRCRRRRFVWRDVDASVVPAHRCYPAA